MTEPMSNERLAEMRRWADGSVGRLAAFSPEEARELVTEAERAREALGQAEAALARSEQETKHAWSDFKIAQEDRDDAEAALDRLRQENEALKDTSKWVIYGTWLAEVTPEHAEYVPGYGIVPGSDLAPIVNLSTLPGWEDKDA